MGLKSGNLPSDVPSHWSWWFKLLDPSVNHERERLSSKSTLVNQKIPQKLQTEPLSQLSAKLFPSVCPPPCYCSCLFVLYFQVCVRVCVCVNVTHKGHSRRTLPYLQLHLPPLYIYMHRFVRVRASFSWWTICNCVLIIRQLKQPTEDMRLMMLNQCVFILIHSCRRQ